MHGNNYDRYTPRQLAGSEYGGTESRNTIQPKGQEALTNSDRLRLDYLVGDTSDPLQETPLSLEDNRQMLGLRPATGRRPVWLAGTGRVTEAEIAGAEYPDNFDVPEGY